MLQRLKSHHLGSIVAAAILVVAAFVGASLAGAADQAGTVSSSAASCGPGGGPSQPIGPSGPSGPCTPARVAVVAGTTWTLGGAQPGATLPPFTYGTRPLTPIMGDWNCDGLNTVGTFERGTFRLNDQNDSSDPEHTFVFGDPRGFAVAGDFDGNCYDDVAVYRAGLWQVHYLGPGAPPDATFTLSAPFATGTWPNTVPVAGDWDGDGIDGIGTYDLATATWVLKNTAGPGGPDIGPFVFGTPGGSYPVVGDWNGDGFDTPGYRSLTGTTWTVRVSFITSGTTRSFDFGAPNTLPLTW